MCSGDDYQQIDFWKPRRYFCFSKMNNKFIDVLLTTKYIPHYYFNESNLKPVSEEKLRTLLHETKA